MSLGRDTLQRLQYAAPGALTLVAGLLWRKRVFHLPHFLSKYGADALWSLLVFLGLRFLLPRANVWRAAVAALLFSFAVEFSQLYHAPWIDSLRRTTLGGLVLGDVFNWPDFGAYTAGVLCGVLLDFLLVALTRRDRTEAG